jgi:hypothetical protein
VKEQCTPLVREVLSSKRIALWESLLVASKFPDMEIVEVVKKGADLTGEPDTSPLFPFDWKPAVASQEVVSLVRVETQSPSNPCRGRRKP